MPQKTSNRHYFTVRSLSKKNKEKKLEHWNASAISVSEGWLLKEVPTGNVCRAEISLVAELALCFTVSTAQVDRAFFSHCELNVHIELLPALRALVRLNLMDKCE